jgi:hypothetical protein
MSGKNKVNPDHYKVAGRLSQDDLARARRTQSEPLFGATRGRQDKPLPPWMLKEQPTSQGAQDASAGAAIDGDTSTPARTKAKPTPRKKAKTAKTSTRTAKTVNKTVKSAKAAKAKSPTARKTATRRPASSKTAKRRPTSSKTAKRRPAPKSRGAVANKSRSTSAAKSRKAKKKTR